MGPVIVSSSSAKGKQPATETPLFTTDKGYEMRHFLKIDNVSKDALDGVIATVFAEVFEITLPQHS